MMYVIEQTDAALANSTALISYTLNFAESARHLVSVTIAVGQIDQDQVILVLPAWTPGSYKIRDYSANQGNLRAFDCSGSGRVPINIRWRDKSSLVLVTKGVTAIEVEYVVFGFERSVRTNHITRNHAFIVPAATLMYVEGRMNEIHHVVIKRDSSAWPSITTPLSPVQRQHPDGLLLAAANYDVLADSPIELGSHTTTSFVAHGATHEVAVESNQPVDVDWLVKQIQRIVDVEAQIFGGLPYDRYVFIVQVYPGGGGGLEHSRCSVNAVEAAMFLDKAKVSKLLSLLCHEFFHTWNVKRIRPIELGPFNYQQEVYTPMLWLAEGLTSYYDDLLHYRCGFATQKEYLETLAKEHILKLMRVPGRHVMSVRDSSLLAWVKLYQAGADGINRFPSYYLAGGVVMLLLDLHIIAHTDGSRSLDDALRALWKRYLDNKEMGLTEDETIAIMERATGVQFRDMLMQWLSGTEDLPVDRLLADVGYSLVQKNKESEIQKFGEQINFTTVPDPVFVGWLLADKNGGVVVKQVEDHGPAALAGIGTEDEILAVNNKRVTSAAHVAQLLSAFGASSILAQCDGVTYSTTLQPMPEPFVAIDPINNATPQQLRNRERWLQRII